MIPIGELRIGNKIIGMYGEEYELSEVVEVSCLDTTGEVTDYPIWVDGNKDHYVDFQPIELTEGLLKDCDFEKKIRHNTISGEVNVWALYSFSLTIWDDGRLFYDWVGGNIEVKHFHHLQNIYADLLRKELTIKK